MTTKKERLDYFRKMNNLKYEDLIDDRSIVTPENLRVTVARDNSKADYYLSLIATKYNISEQWLLYGKGDMKVTDGIKNEKFDDLPIGEQLKSLNEKLDYLIKSDNLNRVYLKTIMVHLDITLENFKPVEEDLEKNKKTTSS